VRRAYEIGRRARFAVDVRIARARDRLWRPREHDARLTVVLLSFARPRNIQPIAESVLRCGFVDRLVISNNDPRVRLTDHVRIASPRAAILEQEAPCPPMRRFEIARELPGEYFLALDDDVLLRAPQIDAVFRALVNDPGVPHGIIGQVMDGEERAGVRSYRLVERRDGTVDVLNRAYFFTAAHRDRFFTLLAAIGRQPLRYGDDIVLSFSGERRPRIHDVGRVLYFPSGDDPAVARWLEPGFQEYRTAVYGDLIAITSRR
jgi:hypothetical protein